MIVFKGTSTDIHVRRECPGKKWALMFSHSIGKEKSSFFIWTLHWRYSKRRPRPLRTHQEPVRTALWPPLIKEA